MSWIGYNRSLSRCLLASSHLAPDRLVVARQSIRSATTATAAKTRAKKTAAITSDEPVTIPKKKLSTKSTTVTVAAPAKSPRKKKVDATAAAAESAAGEVVATVVKKGARAASNKSSTSTSTRRKKADETAEAKGVSAPPRFAKSAKATAAEVKTTATVVPEPLSAPQAQSPPSPATEPVASTSTPSEPSSPASVEEPLPRAPSLGPNMAGPRPPAKPELEDIKKTPEFKRASKKWISVIVALPILLVTSYHLFDRLALGTGPKDVSSLRKASPQEPTSSDRGSGSAAQVA